MQLARIVNVYIYIYKSTYYRIELFRVNNVYEIFIRLAHMNEVLSKIAKYRKHS